MAKPISEATRRWLEGNELGEREAKRYARKRIAMPRYARMRKGGLWTPSDGAYFATGDDTDRIIAAAQRAYGRYDLALEKTERLAERIRAVEIARAMGYDSAFCCFHENGDDIVFMLAQLRRYRKTAEEEFDIEYLWLYEWFSTFEHNSRAFWALLRDFQKFYGHISVRAKRPLNCRARTRVATSARAPARFKAQLERELARRGMPSTFTIIKRKQDGDRLLLAMNNSLNREADAARRAERKRLKEEAAAKTRETASTPSVAAE